MKYKQAKISKENFIDVPFEANLRFYASKTGGLNIVPVDLAAKIMYNSCVLNDNNESYHLTNKEETPHQIYTSIMLKAINVIGVKNTDTMPTNLNRFESFYYKAIDQLMPYITQDPILFDTSSSEAVCNKVNIAYPIIDENSFLQLMNYAKLKQFGLNIDNRIDSVLSQNKFEFDSNKDLTHIMLSDIANYQLARI